MVYLTHNTLSSYTHTSYSNHANPTWAGCMMFPNPPWEIVSRSNFLRPNMPTSVSPPQALLLSSTWCSVFSFLIEKNGYKKTPRKLMMLNKRRRWSHPPRVKRPWVNMSTNWFLVSTYLIWICASKLILQNNQIKRNSVGSGYVSHCGTSALCDHFDLSFIIFKNELLCFGLRKCCVCENFVKT